MKIEPTGVIFTGVCDVQSRRCRARTNAPVTAVWAPPGRTQVNVCRPCLEDMVRGGDWEIPGARIQPRYDLVVLDAHGEVRLVVEVRRNGPGERESAITWARRVHRNLAKYAGVPGDAHFLLIGFPDWFFLWDEATAYDPAAEPAVAFHGPVLDPYLPPGNAGDREEQAVAAWLESLMGESPLAAEPGWLGPSGLLDSIRGGSLAHQATA